MLSLAPEGQDLVSSRKLVFPLSQAVPTAARMVGREAADLPPGTRSSGRSALSVLKQLCPC